MVDPVTKLERVLKPEQAPAGFRWISEDRRRAELDRRAQQRGADRRSSSLAVLPDGRAILTATPAEQLRVRAELQAAGMLNG